VGVNTKNIQKEEGGWIGDRIPFPSLLFIVLFTILSFGRMSKLALSEEKETGWEVYRGSCPAFLGVDRVIGFFLKSSPGQGIGESLSSKF
jgi:hypothetical protein